MGFDVNEMAARLRELRARRNVTQQQVADETGITQSNISAWEQAKVPSGPNYEDAWTLAEYYGVPIGYLGGRTYNEPDPMAQAAYSVVNLTDNTAAVS